MTAEREFIEVQGTGEGGTFSRATMNELLDLAEQGIGELLRMQQDYLKIG
jgi:ribonuclease PH